MNKMKFYVLIEILLYCAKNITWIYLLKNILSVQFSTETTLATFLLPSPECPNLHFSPSNVVLESPFRMAESLQIFPISEYLPNSYHPGFPNLSWEGLWQPCCLLLVPQQPRWRCVSAVTICTDELNFPRSLACGPGFYNSKKAFYCLWWILIFSWEKENKRKDNLHHLDVGNTSVLLRCQFPQFFLYISV